MTCSFCCLSQVADLQAYLGQEQMAHLIVTKEKEKLKEGQCLVVDQRVVAAQHEVHVWRGKYEVVLEMQWAMSHSRSHGQ